MNFANGENNRPKISNNRFGPKVIMFCPERNKREMNPFRSAEVKMTSHDKLKVFLIYTGNRDIYSIVSKVVKFLSQFSLTRFNSETSNLIIEQPLTMTATYCL